MSESHLIFSDEAGVYHQYPNEKTISSSPFYIRANICMSSEAYRVFQNEMQKLNEVYNVPVGEEIKWADLWSLIKNNPRAEFIRSFTSDKLKGYYRRVLTLAKVAKYIFTITSLRGQTCIWKEDTCLRFHLQEALQRVQMDMQQDEGFATLIMDELNTEKLKLIKEACHKMTVEGDFIRKYKNIYHGVLTECSSQSYGIQLADFAAGIMNGYLRGAIYDKGNYTFATDLCKEFILPNLRHSAGGSVMGFGIREVPSMTLIRETLEPYFKNIEFN